MVDLPNISLGKSGEKIAISYLTSLGYKIIDQNFRFRGGEIDLVALDGGSLVFIEVKTRKSEHFGRAEDAITATKRRTLIRSAHVYKLTHKNLPDSLRIDVVTICFTNVLSPQIAVYKNITL
ncbi:YraN family protein [Candidatus Gottesmanbacteria bacterium]|nr:YraN family protein [Candidatus Gottesmanbacteria bacterium]